MQHLEVSGAVRPIYGSLCAKALMGTELRYTAPFMDELVSMKYASLLKSASS
jgi:hypothetical protein